MLESYIFFCCVSGVNALEFRFGSSVGETSYDQLSITAALSSFLDPVGANGSNSSTFSNYQDTIETEYEADFNISILPSNSQFSVGFTNQVYANINSTVMIGYQQGRGQYKFPNGIKPFIEPITVNTTHQLAFINALISSEKEIFRNLHGLLELGVRRSTGWIQSSVTSSLLNVNSNEFHKLDSAVIGLGLSIGSTNKLRFKFVQSKYRSGLLDAFVGFELTNSF